ncbi:MAG: DUF368 domain-containing protein [Planctomycetaceae bacterium]|nr:DUF368 domain-containing protein [Planctomycetaceae bacterium]
MSQTNQTRIPSKEDFAHVGRGLLMGAADIIPGVSGGTVALIVGIYQRLVTSVSHFDGTLIGHVLQRRWRAAAEHVNLRFLAALGIGIGCGVVALGSVMHSLLEHQRQFTLAAFFGLIAASCWLVARYVRRWSAGTIVAVIVGTVFAYWLVQQETLNHPPDSLWYVFACGVIAICAMILPGISGSFILVILGKYHEITGIIKEAAHLQITGHDVATVAVFGSGCIVGLIGFAKVLKWLLWHHHDLTMASLCGFMAGSLVKIWPFQRDLTPEVTELKHKRFELIGLSELALDQRFWVTIGIAMIATGLVLLLDRISRHTSADGNPSTTIT